MLGPRPYPGPTQAPLVAAPGIYFPQPTIAGATGVTYSAADGSYQARPTSSHTGAAIVTTRPLTSYMAGPGTYTLAYASTPTTYSYPPASAVRAAAKPNIYVQPQPGATINLSVQEVRVR